MADRDGVEIYKKFYPWPSRFRLGDPILVSEVTGMTWPEFEAAMTESDADSIDQVALIGLIAVAFWQGNPQMPRDKVRRTIERVPQEDIEIIGSDEPEDDAGPPAEGVDQTPTSSESAASLGADLQTDIPADST